MSAREASYKWGVSESRVHKLCQQGRILGLERFGRSWVIVFCGFGSSFWLRCVLFLPSQNAKVFSVIRMCCRLLYA